MTSDKKLSAVELAAEIDYCSKNLDKVRSCPEVYLFYIKLLKELIVSIDGYTSKIDSIYTKIFENQPNLSDIEMMFNVYMIESMENIKKERVKSLKR